MPKFCHRHKTLDSMSRSSIHQSLATHCSHVAMARSRQATLNDPAQAMELLRSLVQPVINDEIRKIIQKYSDLYFTPALANAKRNLGPENVSDRLLSEVCKNVLENAKDIFDESSVAKKNKLMKRKGIGLGGGPKKKKKKPVGNSGEKVNRPNTDIILVSKTGKPVRREGPNWKPDRLDAETLFILGSKANKALGYGQTRGRLYIKHPELFKYSGDQEDKEWLAKNQLMSTTGGKAYLMVLNDILELSQTPDYASHPRQQPNELLGFQVPDFMVKKMKSFVVHIRTDPSTLDSDLLKQGEEQIAKWEAKRKTFISGAATGGSGGGGGGGNSTDSTAVADPPKEPPLPAVPTPGSSSSGSNAGPGMDLQQPSNLNGPDLEFKVEEDHVIKSETDDHTAAEVQKVEAIINEMKREDASANNNHHGGDVATVHVDDDLGFLHGMKLADLVREFELGAATADGSQHLGILSLADGEEAFPELPDPEEEQSEPENHSTESHHEEEVVTETIAAASGVHDQEQDQDLSEPQQQQLIVEKSSGEVKDETESSGIPEVVSETKPKSEAEPEDISKNLKFS